MAKVQRSYESAKGKGKSLDIKDARVSIVSKKGSPSRWRFFCFRRRASLLIDLTLFEF